ncbi:MAG: hypothetical protein JWN98_632 [Abditibacteriota bacterium]|nr:hypothetical protein [Abditibacteriota bacterium]
MDLIQEGVSRSTDDTIGSAAKHAARPDTLHGHYTGKHSITETGQIKRRVNLNGGSTGSRRGAGLRGGFSRLSEFAQRFLLGGISMNEARKAKQIEDVGDLVAHLGDDQIALMLADLAERRHQ